MSMQYYSSGCCDKLVVICMWYVPQGTREPYLRGYPLYQCKIQLGKPKIQFEKGKDPPHTSNMQKQKDQLIHLISPCRVVPCSTLQYLVQYVIGGRKVRFLTKHNQIQCRESTQTLTSGFPFEQEAKTDVFSPHITFLFLQFPPSHGRISVLLIRGILWRRLRYKLSVGQ